MTCGAQNANTFRHTRPHMFPGLTRREKKKEKNSLVKKQEPVAGLLLRDTGVMVACTSRLGDQMKAKHTDMGQGLED